MLPASFTNGSPRRMSNRFGWLSATIRQPGWAFSTARIAGVANSVSPIRETLMNRIDGRPSGDLPMTCDGAPETRLNAGDDSPRKQRSIGCRGVERDTREAVSVCERRALAVEAAIQRYISPTNCVEHPCYARELN